MAFEILVLSPKQQLYGIDKSYQVRGTLELYLLVCQHTVDKQTGKRSVRAAGRTQTMGYSIWMKGLY